MPNVWHWTRLCNGAGFLRVHGTIWYDVPMSEQLLTPSEVSKILGISQNTLKRMRLDKKGPPAVYLSARTIRYHPDKVAEWITHNEEVNHH